MDNLITAVVKKQSQPAYTAIYIYQGWVSHLSEGDQVTVQYGKESVTCTVIPVSKRGTIALSNTLWEKLSFPFIHRVHVKIEGNQLKLGPLVGIFTTGIRMSVTQPVGRRTGFMQRYLLTRRHTNASFFVFGPGNISTSKKRIRAYFLIRQQNKYIWRRFTVPFPDVVFNRVPNRTSEKSEAVQFARQALEQSGCEIFNPGFFNKWTIHEKLTDQQEVHMYIPETILRPSLLDMTNMLRRFGMIYLKPAGGSLGLGIIQFVQVKSGNVYCRFRTARRNRLIRFRNVTHALQYVQRRFSLSRYIAQQGIPLLTYENRAIDFRVHTNKDQFGEWHITAVAAKVAGKGSVTTHLRSGGKVVAANRVLRHTFSEQWQTILNRMKKAVLQLSTSIEQTIPGNIGEIGFDIGIDTDGHPWMFEANSKPGRHVFAHASMKEGDQQTRNMILRYALHLSRFTTEGKR